MPTRKSHDPRQDAFICLLQRQPFDTKALGQQAQTFVENKGESG